MRHKKYPRKDKGQRVHFKNRLMERYGMTIDRSGIKAIGELIRNGDTIQSRKSTNRVSVHTIIYQGKELRVAYDKSRKQVVSALPK